MIDGIAGASEAETEYPVGTRVRFLDVEGVVIKNNSMDWHRFMTVRLDSGRELLFERDGRYISESDVKLEVIGKVKPKVKKWRWVYQDLNMKWVVSDQFLSESEARSEFCLGEPHQRIDWTMEEQDA